MKTLRVVFANLFIVCVASSAWAQETLNVWTVTFEDSVAAAWDGLISDFEAANPDIRVELETRAVDAHKEALRLTAGSDAGPDIYFFWAGLGLGGDLVRLGMSEALDETYSSLGWDDRFVDAALDRISYTGQKHGVPYTVHGMAVYYRKDLFEQAGITAEPTTYDELVAANDKLLAAGFTPFSFGGSTNWHLMRLLDSLLETTCGAEKHDALKALSASWSEEPCATEAFTELARWNEAGYLGQDYMGIAPQDSNFLVYTGEAAMMLEGDWMVNTISDQGDDLDNYGMFPFPTGTDRLYFFAEMLYLSAGSELKDAAVTFLDYISSPEVQQKYLGAFGSISVANAVDYGSDRRPLDAEWSELFDQYAEVYEPADQAFPLAVNTEFWRLQNGVLTGDVDPAQAAGMLQTFIENSQASN